MANGADQTRLASLDALRGFDMFWIVGGREVVVALAGLTGLPWLREVVAHQTEHAAWHGLRAWDLVFPLFLFLAGVSTTLSFARRQGRGESRSKLAVHALRRGLGLVCLGAIYNGLFAFDLEHQRWASVLGRIGLAWMFAAWLYLALGPRGRVLAVAAILVTYALALRFIPVPGHGAGVLLQGQNLADWIDQRCLPGRLHGGDHDPEGLASTFPAIATALLGMLAGDWLRRTDLNRGRRLAGLMVAGAALLASGYLLSLVVPLNKRLWTSSFALVCGGWSALLLATFHALFDSGHGKRTARVLSIVGAHALTAYLAARFIDFEGLARLLVGRAIDRKLLHEAWLPALALALLWLTMGAYAAARRSRAARER
ncbi:MAG: DUF5009 domain-containing protein [Planctomycetota bacterium]